MPTTLKTVTMNAVTLSVLAQLLFQQLQTRKVEKFCSYLFFHLVGFIGHCVLQKYYNQMFIMKQQCHCQIYFI